MSEEMTWKSIGSGLLAALSALVGVVYKNLSARISKHDEDLKAERELDVVIDRRLSLLEQRTEDRHLQIIETLHSIRTDIAEGKTSDKAWRREITQEVASLKEQVSVYFLVAEKLSGHNHPKET